MKEDLETCYGTSCNFCERNCPVYKELHKKHLLSRGRNRVLLAIEDGKIELSQEMAEAYAKCTGCGACERWCALPNLKMMMKLRQKLVENGFEIPRHKRTKDRVLEYGNTYGEDGKKKSWIEDEMEFGGKGKPLFYTGCSYPSLYPDLLRKFVRIIGSENLQIWKGDEICCGSPILRTGYNDVYELLSEQWADYIRENEITEMIVLCPGCLTTLKKSARNHGLTNVKIHHGISLIAEKIKSGEIEVKRLDTKTTYHDPCHLGRMEGVIDEPREVLKAVSDFTEMEHHGVDSVCCGAGGGVRASNKKLAQEIAKKRVAEAVCTNAEVLTTCCPFCQFNLKVGEDDIPIMDILDLVEKAIVNIGD